MPAMAKWVEVPWLKGKENVVIGSADNIWIFEKVDDAASLQKRTYEYVFQKWDNKKKVWGTKISSGELELGNQFVGEVMCTAAADGSLFFITSPRMDPKHKAWVIDIITHGTEAVLKKMGKNDLVEEYNALIDKVGAEEVVTNYRDIFSTRLDDDQRIQIEQVRDQNSFPPYKGRTAIVPLYRLADKKFEMVYEFDDKYFDNRMSMIGAVNKQELWFEGQQEKYAKTHKEEDRFEYDAWIEKFDGSQLTNRIDVKAIQIKIGADGAVYTLNGINDEKNRIIMVSKLVGSTWKEFAHIQLPAQHSISSWAIVNDKEIWLALDIYQSDSESKNVTKFFCWNGKKLELKGTIDQAGYQAKIIAVHGFTLTQMGDWYQWIEDKKGCVDQEKN